MFRSRNEEFIILDDGEELFRTWSFVAAAEFLKLVNCDHRLERLGRAVDQAYSQFRSPLEKLEMIIDIREL
nr:MAG TPA: hypothetical protein [Caudoviricetes sp.]